VENEWLCAQILGALGLRVAVTDMAAFGTQKVLVVERFDRRWQAVEPDAYNVTGFTPPDHAWIARLPQEDMCQATGTAPTRKYESDGGPTMRTCLDLLGGSVQAEADRVHFTLTQLAFWLLAATDGHAKNFSIFHNRGGSFALTPLYDVISAWPIIGNGPRLISEHDAKLAMAMHSKNTHYELREIRVRHWVTLASRCGAPGLWEKMLQMVSRVDVALSQVQTRLPNDFPAQVWDAVQAGMRRHAEQFLREVDASKAV
jgi:serine/threonine-protein kinase HipA